MTTKAAQTDSSQSAAKKATTKAKTPKATRKPAAKKTSTTRTRKKAAPKSDRWFDETLRIGVTGVLASIEHYIDAVKSDTVIGSALKNPPKSMFEFSNEFDYFVHLTQWRDVYVSSINTLSQKLRSEAVGTAYVKFSRESGIEHKVNALSSQIEGRIAMLQKVGGYKGAVSTLAQFVDDEVARYQATEKIAAATFGFPPIVLPNRSE